MEIPNDGSILFVKPRHNFRRASGKSMIISNCRKKNIQRRSENNSGNSAKGIRWSDSLNDKNWHIFSRHAIHQTSQVFSPFWHEMKRNEMKRSTCLLQNKISLLI